MNTEDPAIRAAANTCRITYASANRAIVDYMNGARPATGTLDDTAVMCWLAIIEHQRIISSSHSTKGAAITGEGKQIGESFLYGA